MTDIILSSFISLFALFGKEEQVDGRRAKAMLVSYLRRHFGIRNVDLYLDLYSDMRLAYESSGNLDTRVAVSDICSTLHGNIRATEEALLLLRLMEFCSDDGLQAEGIFKEMARIFNIPASHYRCYLDYVNNVPTEYVKFHSLKHVDGQLKTLLDPATGFLLFTYLGHDTVLLNDIPVLPGTYQVWLQSSVLKSRDGHPLYYSTIIRSYEQDEMTTQSVTFCGRDVNFRFPGSDNGMHNLSFTLHSGEMLAVMGGSGTGKTTLMSLLNGSLTPQQGTLTINGHSITEPAAKALIGFVPQDDLLIEELTVYQNLWYTAKLCFEGMNDADLDRRVMKTLKDLGLDSVKDLKVGSPIHKLISGGQRKRLNIALELIREPAVLFLDEPTSGLSSADTEKVVNLLKEQTLKGKLIVVNIHQPSSDVYKLFDRLWLLDKGGYPVFDGNPIDAVTYFKEAANYADAETSACPTCGNINPEVVLNIINEKALNSSGELSDVRKTSPEEWHELYLKKQEKLLQEPVAVTDIPASDQKNPGVLKQFCIFLRRTVHSKISNTQYWAIALLQAPLLALVCSYLTRFAPPEGYSVMNNKNLVSYFFMAVIVATLTGMTGSAEEIFKDRALLKRERFLHLSYAGYIWSKVVFMGLLSLVQTLLFIVVGNLVMGISGLFFTWWLVLFVTAFLANLTGLLLSQCLNSIVGIYISIPLLIIPQILLCGLVVSFQDLTPKSTTGNVPLVGNLIPSRWAYEALAVTSFTDNPYERHFFDVDRQKYENQFFNMGYLYELQSQLQTLHNEQQRGLTGDQHHLDVIRTNMPRLATFCGLQPYTGDYGYQSLSDYMHRAEQLLSKRSNQLALQREAVMNRLIKQYGKEGVVQLKRDNYNLKLEECVVGADQQTVVDVVDNVIVPRAGLVFLTPFTTWGNAPFYSSQKVVGPLHVKTLWFNLSVLLLMSLLAIVLLLTDCPGRYLRC
jgi:ABC-type multidrug transport system ATPase subunit